MYRPEYEPLRGKVALVTGASGGIGGETAIALAEAGAAVALNYASWPERAAEVAEQIVRFGGRAMHVPADVSKYEEVERIVAEVTEKFGSLDVLVSRVAYSSRQVFYEANLADFRRTIDVTMFGAFNTLRASSLQMIRQGTGGSVVIVSSPLAHIPMGTMMAYGMAKAGLDQMVRIAALELREHRVRVNSIHPGWTDTPGERSMYGDAAVEQGGASLPNGRLAQPHEIAQSIRFLASNESELMNGSILTVDGGFHLPGQHQWTARRDV